MANGHSTRIKPLCCHMLYLGSTTISPSATKGLFETQEMDGESEKADTMQVFEAQTTPLENLAFPS